MTLQTPGTLGLRCFQKTDSSAVKSTVLPQDITSIVIEIQKIFDNPQLLREDFEELRHLGRGAFGEVLSDPQVISRLMGVA